MSASAQDPADTRAFAVDTWPGSPQQAELLASERADPEWSATMEPEIVDGLLGLLAPSLDEDSLVVECRATMCGVFFNQIVADRFPRASEAGGSDSSAITDPLRRFFRELGFRGFSNVVGFSTGSDGITVANVEWTAIQMGNGPMPQVSSQDLLLTPLGSFPSGYERF